MDKNYKKSLSNLENKIGDKNVSELQSLDRCLSFDLLIDLEQENPHEPKIRQCQIHNQHRGISEECLGIK